MRKWIAKKLAAWVLQTELAAMKEISQLRKDKQTLLEVADWAETLLCSSRPFMVECSIKIWDGHIRDWRDKKHTVPRLSP